MAKSNKRITEALKKVDREKEYEPAEAISLVKELATAKFDESIDVALKLGVDPRHAEQQVRGTVVLPNGTGKTIKVAVFAQGEKAKEAEEAGADIVGGEDLSKDVMEGNINFDVAVATPDMMSVVGRLGRILGPKGLMPNPKAGTVTNDIKKAVEEIKAGKVEYRVTKESGIHVSIGKASFDEKDIAENFKAFMEAIIRSRPASAKGQYLRKVAISSTMSPGIKVSPQAVQSWLAETEKAS